MYINIENVSKSFNREDNELKVLNNINLPIEEGEFVCLLGQSGCGKSTILNMLAAFDKPTEGKISIENVEVTKPRIDRVTIFQNYGLLPWRNVEKNVKLGLESLNKSKKEKQEIADKYIKLVGLEKFKKSFPIELSGGMQQRVAIARALAVKPKILFMDEPFGALDPITRKKLQEDIKELWKTEKNTIIFVTHDVEEALFLASKIVIMTPNPGRIKAVIDNSNTEKIDKVSSGFYDMKDKILGILEENNNDKIEYYI
jgi:NitT/TauT family transport system ATP-binding protein